MDERGSSDSLPDGTVEQDVIDRLARFGRSGVPSATASAHLTAIAAASARRRAHWRRVRVGAAFLAGLLVGGTGLASAGALPGSAQAVAHDVLGAVGVGVPDRSTEGCPEGETFRNHGEFVSSRATKAEKQAAAKSPCGKPVGATDADADVDADADADVDGADRSGADNPCRPPWAGGGEPASAGKGLTAEERAAQRESAKAEREAWRASRPAECAADEAEGSEDLDEVEETETDESVEADDDDQADEADDIDDDGGAGGGAADPADPNGPNPNPPAAEPADPPAGGES